jgi:hypothetical protein
MRTYIPARVLRLKFPHIRNSARDGANGFYTGERGAKPRASLARPNRVGIMRKIVLLIVAIALFLSTARPKT